jgi:catechol 2,3-dioxygenase-like lactoylglutathione lyase family enzyme
MNEENHGVRFQRANFVVTDMERALRLYCDILGMKVEFMKESAPDSYSYPVFAIDHAAKLGFAILSTPTQPRIMALTEIRGMDIPRNPPPRRSAIVLDVPNLDEVIAACKGAGFETYPEDELVTHDGRRGREYGIVDADDNLIVIYHITSAG